MINLKLIIVKFEFRKVKLKTYAYYYHLTNKQAMPSVDNYSFATVQ